MATETAAAEAVGAAAAEATAVEEDVCSRLLVAGTGQGA